MASSAVNDGQAKKRPRTDVAPQESDVVAHHLYGVSVWGPVEVREEFPLTPPQKEVCDAIRDATKPMVLVGGAAGTGKTTCLRHMLAELRQEAVNMATRLHEQHPEGKPWAYFTGLAEKRQPCAAAPDWIAARLISCSRGLTICGMFGITPAELAKLITYPPDAGGYARFTSEGEKFVQRYFNAFCSGSNKAVFPSVLFLDECSKLSRFMLDLVVLVFGRMTALMRKKVGVKHVAGGADVRRHLLQPPKIVLGFDVFQIPPVCTQHELAVCPEKGQFFFESRFVRDLLDPTTGRYIDCVMYMTESMRHGSKEYCDFLNRVRMGKPSAEDKLEIASLTVRDRTGCDDPRTPGIRICALRDTVNAFTRQALLVHKHRHIFKRTLTFADPPLGRRDPVLRENYKQSTKRHEDDPELGLGMFVIARSPIQYMTDEVFATNSTGYIVRLIGSSASPDGVCVRPTNTLSAEELEQLRAGVSLPPSLQDVNVIYKTFNTVLDDGSRVTDRFFPIQYGGATTIHSVQGLTLIPGRDVVFAMASEAWLVAQIYVVLSRHAVSSIRELRDSLLFVENVRWSKLQIPPGVMEFYNNCRHI
jgi:hypothetical protein